MKKILRLIDLAIKKQGLKPKFYVIGGSDIYGFKSRESGDIDVRGFHIAPKEQFWEIYQPKEQIIVNQSGITQGFEDFKEFDFVSYELRKFGRLLLKMNFNILEWLFCGKRVLNGIPLAVDSLKEHIRGELPGVVPIHYYGMSCQNYRKFLDIERDGYKPTAKKFLYVIRGLLAAGYLIKNKKIESDITKVTDNKIVQELIEIKRQDENAIVPIALENKARKLINELDNKHLNYESEKPSNDYEDYINKWMVKLR